MVLAGRRAAQTRMVALANDVAENAGAREVGLDEDGSSQLLRTHTAALGDQMLSGPSARRCSSRAVVGEWVRIPGRTAGLLDPLEPMDTAAARQQHGQPQTQLQTPSASTRVRSRAMIT